MRPVAYVREVFAAALSQRVFTTLSALLVAGATVTILITSGRAAATEAAVLSTVDEQGTRTVLVQGRGDIPVLPVTLVDQISAMPIVESVVGFGPVRDVTAAAIPDGPRIGSRTVYGTLGDTSIGQPPAAGGASPQYVWTSARASRALGLPRGTGSVRIIDGAEFQVAGNVTVPEYLQGFEPLAVVPLSGAGRDQQPQLTTVVVLARTSQDVALVGRLVRPLLEDVPRDGVSVATSEGMAGLRAAIGGELTAQARAITLVVLSSATALTLVNVWGFVLMRRKDLGRRRALGATRLMIVALVVGQVAVTAALSAIAGAVVGLTWLDVSGSPAPQASYVVAVVTALLTTAAVAALLPAAIAARRDPLRELRVP